MFLMKHADTQFISREFRWRGPFLWNYLLIDIRMINKIGAFKRRLNNWIRENIPIHGPIIENYLIEEDDWCVWKSILW